MTWLRVQVIFNALVMLTLIGWALAKKRIIERIFSSKPAPMGRNGRMRALLSKAGK